MSDSGNTEEDETSDSDLFYVQVPDVLSGDNTAVPPTTNDDGDWYKVKGWYNELNFYSKVFNFSLKISKRQSLSMDGGSY